MFSIFFAMKVPMSVVIAIAAFLAAATSAVIELDPAAMRSELAHVPAARAFSFWSPM
jgi:hypothetical protein